MNQTEIKEGLTFDDVLLIPQKSAIDSRKKVDLSVTLAPSIKLYLPIIAAPMDTVCESEMATALARLGGLGIIHRFCPIEKQVLEVTKVKRAENYFVEQPISVSPQAKLKEILAQTEILKSRSFLVVDEENRLLGLITKRDYLFEEDLEKEVQELMTPFKKLICVDSFISLEKAKELFKKHRIEKLPVIGTDRKVKGLITAKDVIQCSNQQAARDKKGRLLVGAAIGVRGDYLERAQALVKAGVDILVVDIAHGHLEKCMQTTEEIKNKFPDLPLIVGNVATLEGAVDLKESGADIIKVGIGPGSVCLTRIVSGAGVPQLTCVWETKKGVGDTPILADGGIRTSGDIVKALAAGASAVVIGSMFAGTDEAPGKIAFWNGKRVKLYRGMASFAAYEEKNRQVEKQEMGDYTPEGADQAFVDYKGSVVEVLKQLEGGIQSGYSYCGAKNIVELWQNAKFIKITPAGIKESGIHDITTAN